MGSKKVYYVVREVERKKELINLEKDNKGIFVIINLCWSKVGLNLFLRIFLFCLISLYMKWYIGDI